MKSQIIADGDENCISFPGKPILTIAIPTWNRSDILRQTLFSILAQIHSNQLDSDVELLVSDNGSCDSTREVCQELRSQYCHLSFRYRCNHTNLGFDENFLNCLNSAHGSFVWTISDDDLVTGSIASVVKFLSENQHVSYVNLASSDSAITEFTSTLEDERSTNLPGSDFVMNSNLSFTFLSSNIYSRRKITEIDFSTLKNIPGCRDMLFFFTALKICGEEDAIVGVISRKIIQAKQENLTEVRKKGLVRQHQTRRFKLNVEHFLKIYFDLLSLEDVFAKFGYKPAVYYRINQVLKKNMPRQILYYRVSGVSQGPSFLLGALDELALKFNIFGVLIGLLILACPRPVLVTLRKMYRSRSVRF